MIRDALIFVAGMVTLPLIILLLFLLSDDTPEPYDASGEEQ